MPMCQAGREVPGQGLVTERLLFEDAWGEAWEARHERMGRVFFVAYCTAEGMALFRACKPTLQRWKDGHFNAQVLMRILELSADSAVPYVLVEATKGQNLRQEAAAEGFYMDPEDTIRDFFPLLKGVPEANGLDIAPLCLTPDTVFRTPEHPRYPLRVLPVAPGILAEHAALVEDGRYLPPPDGTTGPIGLRNPDSYALIWLLIEYIQGRWDLPRTPEAVAEAVPAVKLQNHLKASLSAPNGACAEPKVLGLLLREWLDKEAAKDVSAWRKQSAKDYRKRTGQAPPPRRTTAKAAPAKAAAKSSPLGKIGRAFLWVFVVLLLMVGVAFGLWKGQHLLGEPSPTSFTSPTGAATAFFDAVYDGSESRAKNLMADASPQDLAKLLEDLRQLDARYQIKRGGTGFKVTTERVGQGTVGTGEIVAADGIPIYRVRVDLRQAEDQSWKVSGIRPEALTP